MAAKPQLGEKHKSNKSKPFRSRLYTWSVYVVFFSILGSFLNYIDKNIDISQLDWLLFHPERSHLESFNNTLPFFEGWYYKIATKEFQIAIIPGVYRSKSLKHSFVYLITTDHCFTYHYPISQFKIITDNTNGESFHIQIGDNNHFSDKSIKLSLDSQYLVHIAPIMLQNSDINSVYSKYFDTQNGNSNYNTSERIVKYVKNELKFDSIHASLSFDSIAQGFPISLFQLGAMGYYGYIPILECYHGTLSMDYLVYGNVNLMSGNKISKQLYYFAKPNKKSKSKDDNEKDKHDEYEYEYGEVARGYLEKDWGTNFPQTWIWFQANHFDNIPDGSNSISMALALARLPITRHYTMPGFLGALWFNNSLYSFSTWTWTKVNNLNITYLDSNQLDNYNDKNIQNKLNDTRLVSVELHSFWNDKRIYVEIVIPNIDDKKYDHGYPHCPQPREHGWVYSLVEFVNATVKIRFENDNDNIVWSATSFPSAVEVHGGIDYLQNHFQ